MHHCSHPQPESGHFWSVEVRSHFGSWHDQICFHSVSLSTCTKFTSLPSSVRKSYLTCILLCECQILKGTCYNEKRHQDSPESRLHEQDNLSKRTPRFNEYKEVLILCMRENNPEQKTSSESNSFIHGLYEVEFLLPAAVRRFSVPGDVKDVRSTITAEFEESLLSPPLTPPSSKSSSSLSTLL